MTRHSTDGTMDKEGRYTAGSLKAAEGAINAAGWGLSLEQTAEIISRETADKEMADLLRDFIEWQATNADNVSRPIALELRAMAIRAEKLLTKIGETP